MNYLSAENIEKNFGERILFSFLSLGIQKGDKAGLVAANGTGKTSLLDILAGKEEPESGKVILRDNIRLSYLEQQPVFNENIPVRELFESHSTHIMAVKKNYKLALARHAKHSDASSSRLLEEATLQMDLHHAWDYERKLTEMLDRFAVNKPDHIIGELSGGQKKRLALSLVLLDHPDILLLDEPTNHLDIEMIEWLEDYLSRPEITFLMVTHDRYFLENICNHIFELSNQRLFRHEGNFEFFLKKKAEREELENTEKEKAAKYVKHEQEWIRRMPQARTSKSKSRINRFHEAKNTVGGKKPEKKLEIDMNMSRLGSKILNVSNLSKRFNEQIILDDFSYKFRKGERIGVIGSNGSGKTSLLNLLAGKLPPDNGKIEYGETLVIGYYRQEGKDFDEGKKVIDAVRDVAEFFRTGSGVETSAAQLLQLFLFPPDMHYQSISKLSGGEKRKLYLLTVLMKNPNFLILDEPTNDLDILTLNVLEKFLAEFSGCLILVSHDRFFLNRLSEHLFIFEGEGRINDFYGSYENYRNEKQALEHERKSAIEKNKPVSEPKKVVKEKPEKLSYREQREYEELGKEIEDLENEKKSLEDKLDTIASDYQKLNEVSERISKIIDTLDEKFNRWLELDERNS